MFSDHNNINNQGQLYHINYSISCTSKDIYICPCLVSEWSGMQNKRNSMEDGVKLKEMSLDSHCVLAHFTSPRGIFIKWDDSISYTSFVTTGRNGFCSLSPKLFLPLLAQNSYHLSVFGLTSFEQWNDARLSHLLLSYTCSWLFRSTVPKLFEPTDHSTHVFIYLFIAESHGPLLSNF